MMLFVMSAVTILTEITKFNLALPCFVLISEQQTVRFSRSPPEGCVTSNRDIVQSLQSAGWLSGYLRVGTHL
jgi:hypothetical protein